MRPRKLTFALVGRLNTSNIKHPLASIEEFLCNAGHDIAYESETAKSIDAPDSKVMTIDEIGRNADAAIVVGGDGTMIGIARRLAPYGVPLIGINHGRLGFLADIPLDQMIPVLSDILDGKFESERRSLLEGTVIRNNEKIEQSTAFNDIVIARGGGAGMMDLRVTVDDHFMYNQRSDGLVIATPTGSTAYSLSVGGPLLHPSLDGIVLASIAPHSLSNRPIVVPDTSEIVIEILDANNPAINFDSHLFSSVQTGDRIIIQRSKCFLTFLHPPGWSYYDTLREKLRWNESREHPVPPPNWVTKAKDA